MVAPKLRRRGAWPGVTDATRAALADSEVAAADAVDQIGRWARPSPTPVEVAGDYQAQPWDLVIARAAGTVFLPEPSASNQRSEVTVIRLTSELVTVVPLSGLVDGTTSATPSPNRSVTLVSSGYGWHSNG